MQYIHENICDFVILWLFVCLNWLVRIHLMFVRISKTYIYLAWDQSLNRKSISTFDHLESIKIYPYRYHFNTFPSFLLVLVQMIIISSATQIWVTGLNNSMASTTYYLNQTLFVPLGNTDYVTLSWQIRSNRKSECGDGRNWLS